MFVQNETYFYIPSPGFDTCYRRSEGLTKVGQSILPPTRSNSQIRRRLLEKLKVWGNRSGKIGVFVNVMGM